MFVLTLAFVSSDFCSASSFPISSIILEQASNAGPSSAKTSPPSLDWLMVLGIRACAREITFNGY